MKTPHAILIGLALVAAALFFREPSVSPAHASSGITKQDVRDVLNTCKVWHYTKQWSRIQQCK